MEEYLTDIPAWGRALIEHLIQTCQGCGGQGSYFGFNGIGVAATATPCEKCAGLRALLSENQ